MFTESVYSEYNRNILTFNTLNIHIKRMTFRRIYNPPNDFLFPDQELVSKKNTQEEHQT
jgi:hypothetical protein